MGSVSVPTMILTSDVGNQWLPAMAFMWNRHVSSVWPVRVFGFTPPEFELPKNFSFTSLGDFADFPAQRWGAGLRLAVEQMPERFIFLLEDFWPVRPVNIFALAILDEFMQSNPSALRVDLTADRLNARGIDNQSAARDVGAWGHLDIIETLPPSAYQMSTMPAIWNRDVLLEFIEPNETAWDFEIQGSSRVNRAGTRVFGTRQFPMRITVAVQRGRLDPKARWMVPPPMTTDADIDAMIEAGCLPQDVQR